MGLEHESRHPQLPKAACQGQVGGLAPEDVRVEVEVEVVGPTHELAGPRRRDGMLGHALISSKVESGTYRYQP